MAERFPQRKPFRAEDIPGWKDISELDPEVHAKRLALLNDATEREILREDSVIEREPGSPWPGRIWFGFWSLGSLALLIAIAISCAAKFTDTTAMASINMTHFVGDFGTWGDLSNTPQQVFVFGNMSTEEYFGLEALPYVYHFGFAGICRQKNDTTNCSQHFSPSLNLLSAIATDINNTETLANWANFLNSTEYPLLLSGKAISYPAMGHVSAIFILISIILTIAGILNTLMLPRPMAIEGLALHLLDVLLLIVAAIIWTLSFFYEISKGNTAYDGIYRPSSFGKGCLGPGFGMLWAAIGAKLLAKPQLLVVVIGCALCGIPPIGLGVAFILLFSGKDGLSEVWAVVKKAFRLRPSSHNV